jgi:hypothetical protein
VRVILNIKLEFKAMRFGAARHCPLNEFRWISASRLDVAGYGHVK